MPIEGLVIGAALAVTVGGFASVVGLDRERSFYPVVTIVIATYYILFAVMAAPVTTLAIEILVSLFFSTLAVVGFKRTLWVVVAALAAHGLFDFVHSAFISNPGVPAWWPSFCLAYDVFAALYLTWLIKRGHFSIER